MDRKQFLKSSLLLGGLGLAGSAILVESCKKSSSTSSAQGPSVNFTLDLSQTSNSALNTVGGSVAANGVVVICSATNTYNALAQSCTHQGCSLSYSSNKMVCPCHGGSFDMSGNVVSGPPSVPIKKYSVTKSGNILTISG
jgi:cytochrome b6-f complex iron-sulfur subunit